MPSVDLIHAARRYLAQRADGTGARSELAQLTHDGAPDEDFCREVADHFARQPMRAWSDELATQYALFTQESMRQYEALVASGVRVRPWQGEGQPYRGTRHLIASLRATGTLFVLLSNEHHGPHSGRAAEGDPPTHPMRATSGVEVDGVQLCHNDIFRAVHDAFGHAMFGHSMGPVGEFRATRCHMEMYPTRVHPVLFTEQISQICWFFYGPHLRSADGRLPARGDPEWVPPHQRPYPEQKVFPCPPDLLARFRASFHAPAGTEAS